MPQLGETVAEGKITQWFKSAGDPIVSGDNLFEIETDKYRWRCPRPGRPGCFTEIRVRPRSRGRRRVVAVISGGAVRARGACCSGSAPPCLPLPQLPLRDPRLSMATLSLLSRTDHDSRWSGKADPFFEVCTPARTMVRRGSPGSSGHAACPPPRGRRRVSILLRCADRARMAASSLAISRPRAPAPPRRHRRRLATDRAPRDQKRSHRGVAFEELLSTECATPSPGEWLRQNSPFRTSI